MPFSRRSVVAGVCAGSAHLLLSRSVPAAALGGFRDGGAGTAAKPGLLNLTLTAVSAGTLQISISPANDAPRMTELGVVDRVLPAPLLQTGPERDETVAWGRYRVTVAANPLRISVAEGGRVRQQVRFATDSTDVSFDVRGPVFGLGEGAHPFDRRGTRIGMQNGEHSGDLETFGARVPIPWVISPEGWGVFVGQPSGFFEFSEVEARFRGVEATSTRNVYLLLGETAVEVLREYAGLTGYPQLPPVWAFGYQQSHRTLRSREEIVAEARTFREKKLPCDAMIYLGTGFCPSGWNSGHGSFTFNAEVFPDPAEVVRTMHEEHLKVILHVVPPGDLHGSVGDTGVAAAKPGDAVAYWAKHTELRRATGVDGWWPDEGDELSVYARLERNAMYWEGSRRDEPEKRPFALHRNGYAGLQRYGWLWSGDTLSTWKALRAQIMVGISVGLSGIPYWGSDTGGFVPTEEYTPELFVRWFQFSAFCPSFRSHGRAWKLHLPWGWDLGTSEPREVGTGLPGWPAAADLHRPEIEGICRRYLNLRYQLLPYLYSCAAEAQRSGMPVMRALWLGYPGDARVALTDDSYLWGDQMLVAPVYEKGATERRVYLPGGAWWDFWTNRRTEGGQEVTVAAPLETMPLFVRAGGIVAMGPVRQHTGEARDAAVTLQVYPGADGRFTWYDDAGEGFGYERGEFLRVECVWTEASRTLTLTRSGEGTLGKGRRVRVVVAGSNTAREAVLGEGTTRVVV